MSDKIVLILSGGMDSATLLYMLKKQGYEVSALSFDYAQKHSKELQHARKIINQGGVDNWNIFDLTDLCNIAPNSALVDRNVEVPEGHYAAPNMRATVVPNRNMIMLSIATAWAINDKAAGVATGVHAGDHAVYPDCRPEFIYHVEQTLKIANEGFIRPDFQVLAPFIHMTKANIVEVGTELGVPFEDTWSCYKGGIKHCGKCGTCVERKEAFQIAKVEDPTEYADDK